MLNLMGRVGRGALAGNSSAGIKEAPAFGCPTVNIGSRQHGRLRAGNVVDTPYDADAIVRAIRRAVEDSDYRQNCSARENPYGDGTAGPRIADVLATIPLGLELVQKKMTF
jgi:UDP-N-acetylglucosamine 2-epimerase (non-hydrolysing)/GDP/UDP-N,N'-diacetylbacillosamine 2-epimerase (hydrolysing)